MRDISLMAQPKNVKKSRGTRRASLALGVPLPVKGYAKSTNGSMACSPMSSSGSQYGGSVNARGNGEYLCFVVQRHSGEWQYARVNEHCFDCVQTPVVYDMHMAPQLLELWKRVVIDGAIPWEDHVRSDTLRIVRHRIECKDSTLEQFGGDDQIADFLRMSAMSKLTDVEARILGLGNLKAKQKMLEAPEFHREDKILMKELTAESRQLSLDSFLKGLSPHE